MRKTASIAAIAILAAGLAGCGKSETAPDATASGSEAAPAMAASAPAAPKALTPGDFEVVGADGKVVSTVSIAADGAYTEREGKALPVSGVAKIVDGKTCFDPSGPKEAVCWTDGATAADGSFTSTDDKGTTVTVRPKAAAPKM